MRRYRNGQVSVRGELAESVTSREAGRKSRHLDD
jgi:hypothetical protein